MELYMQSLMKLINAGLWRLHWLLCAILILEGACVPCALYGQETTLTLPASTLKIPHPDVQALLDRAASLHSAQQWEDALKIYTEALNKAQSLKNRPGEAITLTNMAKVYRSMGQRQKALDQDLLALSIYREIQNRNGEANTLLVIGNAYTVTGPAQKALE